MHQMDIRSRFGTTFLTLTFPHHSLNCYPFSSSKKHKKALISPCCSSNQEKGNTNNDNSGDKSPTDWDKAWSSFKRQGKRTTFSKFDPNKYVSWNPRRSEYPLSEEVDPIKRAERSNLMLWTSPRFTLGGAIVIVTFLLIYTLLAPIM